MLRLRYVNLFEEKILRYFYINKKNLEGNDLSLRRTCDKQSICFSWTIKAEHTFRQRERLTE